MKIPDDFKMSEQDKAEAKAYGLTDETWYFLALDRELRRRGLDHVEPWVLGLSPLPRRDN